MGNYRDLITASQIEGKSRRAVQNFPQGTVIVGLTPAFGQEGKIEGAKLDVGGPLSKNPEVEWGYLGRDDRRICGSIPTGQNLFMSVWWLRPIHSVPRRLREQGGLYWFYRRPLARNPKMDEKSGVTKIGLPALKIEKIGKKDEGKHSEGKSVYR